MILIDAIYINNSGGEVLLDYLVKNIENTDLKVFYLFDKRVEEKYNNLKLKNSYKFIKSGFFSRLFFYLFNKIHFEKIFCFGNFPPPIKSNSYVITYFHQLLFLNNNTHENYKLKIKKLLFKITTKNTNLWMVQTNYIKETLINKYNINNNIVDVIPFYPLLKSTNIQNKNINNFLYISSGHEYKNHINLLKAFVEFYKVNPKATLFLTIGGDFPFLNDFINTLYSKGYPIINYGYLNRVDLLNLYEISEFIVFPSLAESLGLGIIEGIENHCKIIASNLPWLKAVCDPTLLFDPNKVESIYEALINTINNDLKISKLLVEDSIELLLLKLKN